MDPIDNNVNVRPGRSETEGTRPAGGAARTGASGTAATGARGDQVSLTRTAEELLALETRLQELPGVDESRVAELRDAVREGSYRIDPLDIADKLLRAEQERS
ncbi:flagellar biosynthesis anti-sigma factor FlgM [Pseudohaliea sp.]|uniref:flagellar biosynthesis anti-sigma factor FlgM n=1 Tax=Pseudohaliea sp. TaxID=2740289 RepID=UPI0032EF305D